MNVYACIFMNNEAINLEEILENFDQYAALLTEMLISEGATNKIIEGAVYFESEEHSIEFVDELLPLIQNLCLTPIPPLTVGQPEIVTAFSYAGAIFLVPHDDMIGIYNYLETASPPTLEQVLSSEQAMFNFNALHLLRALLKIGNTFTEIWKTLGQQNPSFVGLSAIVTQLTSLVNNAEVSLTIKPKPDAT